MKLLSSSAVMASTNQSLHYYWLKGGSLWPRHTKDVGCQRGISVLTKRSVVAVGGLTGFGQFGQCLTMAQLDSVVVVDGDDFDLQVITHFANV